MRLADVVALIEEAEDTLPTLDSSDAGLVRRLVDTLCELAGLDAVPGSRVN